MKSDYIKSKFCPNFCGWFRSCVPGFLVCCSLTRKEKAMNLAREKLNREINIIEIVKSWRYYDKAFRFLLAEKQRLDFKERTRYITINPDKCDKINTEMRNKSIEMKKSKSIRRQEFSDGFFSSQDSS